MLKAGVAFVAGLREHLLLTWGLLHVLTKIEKSKIPDKKI